MSDATETIITTCPRDCYDTCGIAVIKRAGVIAQVRGDPNHPVSRGRLCAKCSTGYNRDWRDPHVRLTQPLRRSGPPPRQAYPRRGSWWRRYARAIQGCMLKRLPHPKAPLAHCVEFIVNLMAAQERCSRHR